MTHPAPSFEDAEVLAVRKKGALQRKPEWIVQSWSHKLLERIVLAPCEIRGIDKSGAHQASMNTRMMMLGRGCKDGTGDHLVVQGAPIRVLFAEFKFGSGSASPAQDGTAESYERCGIPTVRECRTMAQLVQGLRAAGFRLHGNTDNLAAEYQERANASLRELQLRKGEPRKKKSGKSRPFTDSRPSRRALRVGMARMGL